MIKLPDCRKGVNKILWNGKALTTITIKEKENSGRDDLGHLACINHNISHGEPADENRGRNNPGDPGIMLSQFDMLDIMRNQFIDLEGQRKKDTYPYHNGPE